MAAKAKAKRAPATVWPDYVEPARPDLFGHRAVTANICYQCGGTLRNAEGGWREIFEDLGYKGVGACAICEACHEKRRGV